MTSEPAVIGLFTCRLDAYVGERRAQVYRWSGNSGDDMWLFALIVGLPLVEISLFVTLGAWLGLWATLAIVVGTAALGFWLIRRQGDRARLDLREAMMSQADPGSALASGALRVVAGVLLILPGFLTDTLGALLLIPAVQRAVIAYATRRATQRVGAHLKQRVWEADTAAATSGSSSVRRKDEIIDGTWEELPDDHPRRPSGWTRH